MDYAKMDAALIAALDSAATIAPVDAMAAEDPAQPTFDVFIHTTHPLHAEEARFLTSLGIQGAAPRRRIITARLPAPAIGALSEADWVRALRLSRRLDLAPQKEPGVPRSGAAQSGANESAIAPSFSTEPISTEPIHTP